MHLPEDTTTFLGERVLVVQALGSAKTSPSSLGYRHLCHLIEDLNSVCVGTCCDIAVCVCVLVVQALATACVACGPSQPAETKQATARVVEQLVLLVNPENELDHVGTTGPVSFTRTLPCSAQPWLSPA